MAITTAWVPAPEGHVLMAGECRARDADGQGCALGPIHLLHPHQSTGLRAWLEGRIDRALIRCYHATRADSLEAMESELFAEFDFLPITRQDFVRTEEGGLNTGWTLLVGPFLAPTEKVTIHLRLVCFARSW